MRLKQLAPILDVSIGTVSQLEHGKTNVSRETVARIEGASGGRVTIADLHRKFKAANRAAYLENRAAGRAAMKAFRKTAEPRK